MSCANMSNVKTSLVLSEEYDWFEFLFEMGGNTDMLNDHGHDGRRL